MSSQQGFGNTTARWKELHGVDGNWDGLLHPPDLDLRRTVIHYGEMAHATYDAFNHKRLSPQAGLLRFGRKRFFERVMLLGHASVYRVTRFLYATSSMPVPGTFMVRSVSRGRSRCRESNWIGYVTVATDEGKAALGRRDVVVAWRGTLEALEWIDDLEFVMVPARGLLGEHGSNAMVHRGWLSMYTSSDPASSHNKDGGRDQVLREVRRLVDAHQEVQDEELSITVTGHSLGAALATLNAFDIAENGYNRATRAAAAATATAGFHPSRASAAPASRSDSTARRASGSSASATPATSSPTTRPCCTATWAPSWRSTRPSRRT